MALNHDLSIRTAQAHDSIRIFLFEILMENVGEINTKYFHTKNRMLLMLIYNA